MQQRILWGDLVCTNPESLQRLSELPGAFSGSDSGTAAMRAGCVFGSVAVRWTRYCAARFLLFVVVVYNDDELRGRVHAQTARRYKER